MSISGKSELCLFDESAAQSVVDFGVFQDIYPTTTIDGLQTSVVEFVIQGSQNEYLDLNDTLLSMKVKIVNSDGTAINGAEQPFPCNYFMNALFSDVTLELNDVQIEGGSSMYHYKSTIESMFNFDDDTKRIQLLPAGVASDQKERKKWSTDSKVFDLVGAIRLDFFNQPKYLLPGVNVRIRLTKSNDHFPLSSDPAKPPAAGTTYKTYLQQCILYARRVKVHPSVLEGHKIGLQKKNAVYPYTKSKTVYYSIAQGTQTFIKENLFSSGKIPKFIIVAFVKQSAFDGDLTSSPFYFDHFDVQNVALYLDGQSVPYKRAYEQNFTKNSRQYADTYVRSILQCTELFNKNCNNGIDMNDFANEGYTFFTFNLTPDFDMNQTQQPNDANLRLDIRFKKALPNAINLIAYGIFDANLYITKDREIIRDANN